MRWLSAIVLFLWSVSSFSDPWLFTNRIAVTPVSRAGVFYHLDASGRKSIDVSGDVVGVAWEDNRSGVPQAYVAFKRLAAAQFDKEMPISTGREAYAPSVVALGGGRFLIGWEQDNGVWVRVASPSSLEPSFRIDNSDSSQITLAASAPDKVIAAWCRRDGRYTRIVTTSIDAIAGQPLQMAVGTPVDPKPPINDQIYPAIAATKDDVTVVWEDRREGHTILLFAHGRPGKPFGKAGLLNEPVEKSKNYGRGSGVTRPALVAYSSSQVAATWMDKRGEKTAYDIYAAFSQDGGATFGANELVQDPFAEGYAQWHPAITATAQGQVVVAWDDDRDGSSSFWYAWKTKDGWSGDHTFAAASGKGQQTNPSITFDEHGDLYFVWIDQEVEGGPSRLYYAHGRYSPTK